jgi:hypothetical protein
MNVSEAAQQNPQDEALKKLADQAPNAEVAADGDEGEMKFMTPKDGHVTLRWYRNRSEDIDNAHKTFNDLRAKGYSCFALEKGGKKGEKITTFDPRLKGIILVPAFQGG